MVRRVEYEFLDWVSFPSCIKAINDEVGSFAGINIIREYPVSGGETIRLECMVKGQNISNSHVAIAYWDGTRWVRPRGVDYLPKGSFDWLKFLTERTLGPDAQMINVTVWGGWGLTSEPAVTKLDDAKVYLNGELIYKNTFDNWLPYIVGGITVTAAGVAGVTKYMKVW